MRVVSPNRIDTVRKRRRGMKILLILLILLLLLLLFLGAWMLWFRAPELAPDYLPPEEDPYATDIEGDNEDKLDRPQGGGAIGMTYRPSVQIDLSRKKAELLYQNPGRSNSDVLVQIVIQDVVIAQSGRIAPGKQIVTMDLLPGTASLLEVGGYDARLAVFFYDPVTAERSLLRTEGKIDLTVIE